MKSSAGRPDFVRSTRLAGDPRFLQWLACGFVGDDALAADYLLRMDEHRIAWANDHEPDWSRMRDEERHAYLDRLCGDTVLASVTDTGRDTTLTLGVSGGYDSRTMLHYLRRAQVPVRTFTYGQVGNVDYDLMRRLRRRLDLADHHLIDTSEVEWRLEWFDEAASRLHDLPISPRVLAGRLMDQLYPRRVEVHGYLQGVITDGPAPGRAPAGWEESVAAFLAKNDAFGFQEMMPAGAAQHLFPSVPTLSHDAIPYHLQLNLGYRQLQRIRPAASPHTDYVLPFAAPTWVGFWLNRPASEVAGQSLFIRFLRRLDSEVFFDLPHCGGLTRDEVRRSRLRWLYGTHKSDEPRRVDDPTKALPRGPTQHFCLFACYRNNASFRAMVHESLRRLRGRRLFSEAFIDGIEQRFRDGEHGADRQLNGLVTTDVAVAAGRFS